MDMTDKIHIKKWIKGQINRSFKYIRKLLKLSAGFKNVPVIYKWCLKKTGSRKSSKIHVSLSKARDQWPWEMRLDKANFLDYQQTEHA